MADDDNGPPEKDMKDFQFRQMLKIQINDQPDDMPLARSSLLAVSNVFGLLFTGTSTGECLSVLQDTIFISMQCCIHKALRIDN